mmetsp:Transcript_5954/g.36897  ORF Transcript_5954/g.36897 Transcript_5954/m.36897 type:complete len:213 (+) Transcript_5954:1160-1798(+)
MDVAVRAGHAVHPAWLSKPSLADVARQAGRTRGLAGAEPRHRVVLRSWRHVGVRTRRRIQTTRGQHHGSAPIRLGRRRPLLGSGCSSNQGRTAGGAAHKGALSNDGRRRRASGRLHVGRNPAARNSQGYTSAQSRTGAGTVCTKSGPLDCGCEDTQHPRQSGEREASLRTARKRREEDRLQHLPRMVQVGRCDPQGASGIAIPTYRDRHEGR